MSTLVTIDHIPELIEQLHRACAAIVAETAKDIAVTYADTAAKRTGFMASSAYTVTHAETTYGAALVGSGPMLPEVEKPANDQEAIAAVAAEYAGYVELGTSRMAAQPAFYPAVDRAKSFMEKQFSELEKRIKV